MRTYQECAALVCTSSALELAKSGLVQSRRVANQGAASLGVLSGIRRRVRGSIASFSGESGTVLRWPTARSIATSTAWRRSAPSMCSAGRTSASVEGQQERTILPAAQASVGTDERFERGDVEGDVFDAAVDVQIGGLWHDDRAAEHPGCMVAVWPEGIFIGHLTGVEPDTAARTDSPRHTGRVKTGDEADALVCTESGNELGPAHLQILEGEPDAGMDVQHSEVPGAEHRDVGAGHGFGALVDVAPADRGSAAGGATTEAAA